MENVAFFLKNLSIKIKNGKILHDYDNYQSSLVDYDYTSFMAGTGAASYETKMNELKQFVERTNPKDKPGDTL